MVPMGPPWRGWDLAHDSRPAPGAVDPLPGKGLPASPTTAPGRGCEDGPVSRSVLVVDDDASFRRLAARVLCGSGHVVVGEAGSVEEALMRAVELRPDTALV